MVCYRVWFVTGFHLLVYVLFRVPFVRVPFVGAPSKYVVVGVVEYRLTTEATLTSGVKG
jgi:hypothetical protein